MIALDEGVLALQQREKTRVQQGMRALLQVLNLAADDFTQGVQTLLLFGKVRLCLQQPLFLFRGPVFANRFVVEQRGEVVDADLQVVAANLTLVRFLPRLAQRHHEPIDFVQQLFLEQFRKRDCRLLAEFGVCAFKRQGRFWNLQKVSKSNILG